MNAHWVSTCVYPHKHASMNLVLTTVAMISKTTTCALTVTSSTQTRKFVTVGKNCFIYYKRRKLIEHLLDFDECQFGITCAGHQTCVNTIGSYDCVDNPIKCPPGFFFKDSIQDCEGIINYSNYSNVY